MRSTNIGDLVSLSGRVSEYRRTDRPDDLYLIELDHPANLIVHSSNHVVSPIVIGQDRVPPTQALSSLDLGPDGWLTVPNNLTQVEDKNFALRPDLYGLDFWQSLDGQVVTIKKPVALNFPGYMGPFWAHGDWPVSGKNGRGGLTLSYGLFITILSGRNTYLNRIGRGGWFAICSFRDYFDWACS